MSNNKILTIPNALTIARLVFIIPFVYFFFQYGKKSLLISFIFFFLSSVTDFLDGFLARILKQESEIGKWLDPAIDRIIVFILLFLFTIKGKIFIIIFIIIVSRDIVLSISSLLVKIIFKKKLFEVNYLGKVATASILFSIPFLFLSIYFTGSLSVLLQSLSNSILIWAACMYVLCGFYYFNHLYKTTKNKS